MMSKVLVLLMGLLVSLHVDSLVAGTSSKLTPIQVEIQSTLGFVPNFMKALPDFALAGAWQEMRDFQMNPNTAVPGKYKELIGLAVAAQIPCGYCIYAHTEFARLNGGSTAEVAEAVAVAANTRHWSTFLNGMLLDETKFRAEVAQILTEAGFRPVFAGG